MKLRVAKKVARDPSRYSGQQVYDAAHRLYRRAAQFKDGAAALEALKLRPDASFTTDDDQYLRREQLLGMEERGESLVYHPAIEVPVNNMKPAFRKDGQAHNFNALPFPGQRPWSLKAYQVRTGGKDRGKKSR